MTSSSPATPADAAALCTERLISASPRQIFAAFEQPDLLAKWWGPDGFSNTFQEFDFKSGGRWTFVMHGPDGTSYPNKSVFREVQPDSQIVIDHVVNPLFTLTVTLTPRGEQTHLCWVQKFETAELAARLRSICEPANEQNLNRLEAVLVSQG